MKDWQNVTYYTYAWFTGQHYGMNLEFHTWIDVNGNIDEQIRNDKAWQESHSKYLKDKDVAGHITKNMRPWYVDESGKVVDL